MTQTDRSVVRVKGAKALRALGSGTRQEIVDVLASAAAEVEGVEEAQGVTVARLAELMGRRADGLYFHLRALERAGLVESERSEADSRDGARYRLAGGGVRVALDYGGDAASRRAIARVVRMALRLAEREFERECTRGRGAAGYAAGAARRLWGGRVMGWVDERGLRRVNELLEEIHSVLRSGGAGEGREAVSVGFVLAPAGSGDRERNGRRTRSATVKRAQERT